MQKVETMKTHSQKQDKQEYTKVHLCSSPFSVCVHTHRSEALGQKSRWYSPVHPKKRARRSLPPALLLVKLKNTES